MSAGSAGGPPHDAGVRRTGHPQGSAREGRHAAGMVRAWRFLKPRPGHAPAFREMAAPPAGGK